MNSSKTHSYQGLWYILIASRESYLKLLFKNWFMRNIPERSLVVACKQNDTWTIYEDGDGVRTFRDYKGAEALAKRSNARYISHWEVRELAIRKTHNLYFL